jgi:hypothetical protein
VLISGAVAAILLAGAAAAVLLARAHSPTGVTRYQFAAQSYPGGLTITQLWTLVGGDGSSLDVSMTVGNASAKAVTAQLEEPIPAAVARDPGSVTFTSAVTPLVTGPLVVWDLQLPAHGHDVVSYQVNEPPSGLTEQRLMTYVQAYMAVSRDQKLQLIARPGLVLEVWIHPVKLQLAVGHSAQLTAHGRLYNKHLASRADLSGAVWTTANLAVAVVSPSGRVFGVGAGKVLVYVQIGSIRAQAIVVVSGAGVAATPPAYYSQPPVQSSTSPSPTTSGSPSPTTSGSPSPTISGSPPPTSPPPNTSPTPGATPGAARITQATQPTHRPVDAAAQEAQCRDSLVAW